MITEIEQLLLKEDLRTLVNTYSPSGFEGPICDWIENRLRQNVPQAVIERIENNLILRCEQAENSKTIALVGHLDTVPSEVAGRTASIRDSRIYGRGTSDMKGGLAIILNLLNHTNLSDFRYNLVAIFYSGEEALFKDNGLHQVFKRSALLDGIDLAFILEMTDNRPLVGALGSIHARARIHGKSAHSATPWLGENSIYRAASFLSKLSAIEPKIVLDSGLSFTESISATTIRAGEARNIIPGECDININYRFAPPKSIDQAKIELVTLLEEERIEVTITDETPSGPVPQSNHLLNSFLSIHSLLPQAMQAYTDVALFAAHGIDAINFGPGHVHQAHQIDEYIEMDSLLSCYTTLKEFLCKNP